MSTHTEQPLLRQRGSRMNVYVVRKTPGGRVLHSRLSCSYLSGRVTRIVFEGTAEQMAERWPTGRMMWCKRCGWHAFHAHSEAQRAKAAA